MSVPSKKALKLQQIDSKFLTLEKAAGSAPLCPADERIQSFLAVYLRDIPEKPPILLPTPTFTLDQTGMARILSLPQDKDSFSSDIIQSYRVSQGVLHNPKNDRRTTHGSFHIVEGGIAIPDDKQTVPKSVFARMLECALNPPTDLLKLPYFSASERRSEYFVSLLLRPTVCPAVSGFISEKSSEIRFFAPGAMVSNLDFVESIFGNGGDPYAPENDAALDVEHWTGHTGCVILAPHLTQIRKKDLGLPPKDQASEKQLRDGMYWTDDEEFYNGGEAFKVTCRDRSGVMVTLIADNYFGYCKKEVKTQISFASNLYGLTEEEHSGGAVAFASYDLGEEFQLDETLARKKATFKEVLDFYGFQIELQPEGYAIDKQYRDIIYVPENAKFNLTQQSVSWLDGGELKKIKLLAHLTYILPSGYKISIKKQTGGQSWHLIGTVAEGTFCHKPSTVSGGGKSEISKPIIDAMIQGPVFTADFHKDFDLVEEILKRDFGNRFRNMKERRPSRPILSPKRSLGSVIKLFTPSHEYTEDYNAWLQSLPQYIRELVFVIKRHYRPEWGESWREYFTADRINGNLGHELKFGTMKLVANYLRVGREKDHSWRIFKVRADFAAAIKLQTEDDITASILVPRKYLANSNPDDDSPSLKVVINCEQRLFQRPDDVIYRGYDKQAESDLCGPDVFLCNFEPLTHKDAKEIVQDAIGFDLYTEPVQKLFSEFMNRRKPDYIVAPSHPRLINGVPSKNPRYLQNRPDLMNPRARYLAELGTRLYRKMRPEAPVYFPVNAVLPGRRNNPPDPKAGIPPLAVYNPIHYQELPELFMDFICSVTGKSPSTTGFGSEGALTKGPFNALPSVIDLNNALVSFILTGSHGFSSAAGTVGPNTRVDHDISLLIPEIWCRMNPEERDPQYLIQNGFLEKLEDFEYGGKKVQASLLGYRITLHFANTFLGRIFDHPSRVFTEDMLKPEIQNTDVFVEAIENIVATQKRVAQSYFRDNTIEDACPPLKALLNIMANGQFEGKDINHPEVRSLFSRESLLTSDWYRERLVAKQQRDTDLWKKHVQYLEDFIQSHLENPVLITLALHEKLRLAREHFALVKSESYLEDLSGTLGADPLKFEIQPSSDGKLSWLQERINS